MHRHTQSASARLVCGCVQWTWRSVTVVRGGTDDRRCSLLLSLPSPRSPPLSLLSLPLSFPYLLSLPLSQVFFLSRSIPLRPTLILSLSRVTPFLSVPPPPETIKAPRFYWVKSLTVVGLYPQPSCDAFGTDWVSYGIHAIHKHLCCRKTLARFVCCFPSSTVRPYPVFQSMTKQQQWLL